MYIVIIRTNGDGEIAYGRRYHSLAFHSFTAAKKAADWIEEDPHARVIIVTDPPERE